jgi:hypothetical protein
VRKSGANLRYKRHNSFIGQQAKRQLGVESGGRAPVAIYCWGGRPHGILCQGLVVNTQPEGPSS